MEKKYGGVERLTTRKMITSETNNPPSEVSTQW